MSSTEPQMSGTQPVKDEQSLQQPSDAVRLTTLDPGASATEDSAAAAAGPTSIMADGQPTAEAGTAKGKERAVDTPEADKADNDSLSIEPTVGAAMGSSGPASSDNPVCVITLLLPKGPRHPYRIDEKYLTKRNVEIPDVTETGKKDPLSISIYKLKELILREWRDEWQNDFPKPSSPSSIRLIYFGKLLDDKEQLKKYHLSTENPNMVHMSVRPAEMMEDEEGAKSKSGGRDSRGRDRRGGGCCTIL